MTKSKTYLLVGIAMVIAMIIFVVFALQHPEMSFVGGNNVAYTFYTIYLTVTITMFVLSIIKK